MHIILTLKKIHLINLPTFHHLNETIRVVDWIYIPRSQDIY